MKRDMDLVRRILMELEASDYPLDASVFADGRVTVPQAAYHIEIMQQAGLIKATIARDLSGNLDATAESLTWNGQEFLEAVRSDVMWATVKSTIAKTVGSTTLETVKALAVKIGSELVLG